MNEKSFWDYENGFYLHTPQSRLNKMLAHYELYKLIKELPGDIIEFGVYKCASLIRLATFRATFENDYARRIIGFDAFGKFPIPNENTANDINYIKNFEDAGGDGLSIEDASQILEAKKFSNIKLIKGNVFDTLPDFLTENQHTRIAFLHLDMDVEAPTQFALERCFDKVVKGGVIVIDDYNAVSGATKAVDDFIVNKELRLNKLPFYNVPSYIIKP